MNTKYDFSGQCGIVTEPASGIGKAVALLLAVLWFGVGPN